MNEIQCLECTNGQISPSCPLHRGRCQQLDERAKFGGVDDSWNLKARRTLIAFLFVC